MDDKSLALIRAGRAALTSHQKYFVQVASDAHRQQLSVVSFEAVGAKFIATVITAFCAIWKRS